MGTVFLPHPSVISEMWLQCLLSLGSAAASFPSVVSCRLAVVASASRARVRLCPAAFDGDSTTWVLLRRLSLASAPPRRFRGRFAGRRSRWGVPDARSGRSLLVH